MTYISWSSDFALYLEEYLMHEHHTLGFHGLVIFSNTLKTINFDV